MLLAVKCDQSTFKEVRFLPGLNVVIADRTKESTRKDSRNGLGKSTLIEITHFCLGSAPGSTLKDEHLANWTFSLDLKLAGKNVSVSRNTCEHRTVQVEGADSDWPIKPKHNTKTGKNELTISQWNSLLGSLMFGISPDEETVPFKPSFRGLISYFIRRGPDAYSIPFEQYRKQKETDIQALNTFLLNLDWSYATDWHQLKEKEKLINDLKKAARAGMMKEMLGGTLGDLEAKRVQLELIVQREHEQLTSFRVHPEYEEIEKQANQLTREMHDLENQNFADEHLLDTYKRSIAEETPPSADELLRVYEEVTVVLPSTVKKRFEDVREFHRQLIENHRRFLESEIDRLIKRIESRRSSVAQMSEEKVSLMEVLETHGALEEYTQLQQRHSKTLGQLRDMEQRIVNLKKFEEGKSALAIDKQLLLRRARTDLEERHAQIRKAIAFFNENSQALYQSPGTLAIDVEPTGFKFHIEIERSKSGGVGNMKVFCYDLMFAQLWSEKPQRPGFLIHDSIIFDGVDERQRALSLELAGKESKKRGFQYICMLNSDMIPTKDFSPGFNLLDFVRLRLTDATQEGGLLGIRF